MDPRRFRHRLGEALQAASLNDPDMPVIAIARHRLCILGMFVCVLQAKVYCRCEHWTRKGGGNQVTYMQSAWNS
jgi:hypothetical protein